MKSYTRRDFLKTTTAGTLGLSMPGFLNSCNKSERPNIILIMADDMGFSDLGCYGSEIDTPNIDALAQDGVRFSQFYNAARCCPTRASLMTGLYPHQAGVGFMMEDIESPNYQNHLNDQCVTIPEVLGNSGYNTAMVGKWHIGGAQKSYWPMNRGGFDSYTGLVGGASNYFRPRNKRIVKKNKPFKPPQKRFYMTDFFSDSAVDYTDTYGRQEKPFFMYLAYTAPHWPIQAPETEIQKYLGKYMDGWDKLRERRYNRMKEMGLLKSDDWPLTPRDKGAPAWEDVENKVEWDRKMAVYAAMIDRMDQGIGRLMTKLEELGIDDNTLVMFLSDNGGCPEAIGRNSNTPPGGPDSFMGYHLPWANTSNTPFRLYKHWVHEGGISTPFIARWPKGIKKKNTITHQVGTITDVMATCVDLADADYPDQFKGRDITPLEGKTLSPIFEGEQRKGHDTLFWEHEGNRAVRQGKWKLVAPSFVSWKFESRFSFNGPRNPYTSEWQLYDMEADRTELNDLATEYPEKVKELAATYENWAEQNGIMPWKEYMSRTNIPWLESLKNIKPPSK